MESVRLGMALWFEGGDVKFDYSLIRPSGAILRTKGGRASGPEPLKMTLVLPGIEFWPDKEAF